MRARLLNLLQRLADAFWVLPGVIVVSLAGLGALVVFVQQADAVPPWLPSDWVYGGGETGARTLLGAIASSTISVAGTIFSITIAALTLASNQMGPRLLRNFMRDRGNQMTLGVLLGAFAYALVVLRSVRGGGEDTFVPALGVTIGLALAAACVAVLIYFVHHVASRINVDTVIDLVHGELVEAIERLPDGDAEAARDDVDWAQAEPVAARRSGYVQTIDLHGLAAWTAENQTRLKLLVRPGAYVFAGETWALADPDAEQARAAVEDAVVVARQMAAPANLEYPSRQLVEVALRALSPGVNDPLTAINVLDRFGSALAMLSQRPLAGPVAARDGAATLVVDTITYGELASTMFEMIRQHAGPVPAVLLHLLRVLTRVATLERDPTRLSCLRELATGAHEEGVRAFANPHDLRELEATHAAFLRASASSGRSPAEDD